MSRRALTIAMASLVVVPGCAVYAAHVWAGRTAIEMGTVTATSCPSVAPTNTNFSNRSSEQAEPLAADRLLLCDYSDFIPGNPLVLGAHTLVTNQSAINQLRMSINALPAAPQTVHCVLERPGEILEVFGIGDHEVKLYQYLDECELVTSTVRDVYGGYQSVSGRQALALLGIQS